MHAHNFPVIFYAVLAQEGLQTAHEVYQWYVYKKLEWIGMMHYAKVDAKNKEE